MTDTRRGADEENAYLARLRETTSLRESEQSAEKAWAEVERLLAKVRKLEAEGERRRQDLFATQAALGKTRCEVDRLKARIAHLERIEAAARRRDQVEDLRPGFEFPPCVEYNGAVQALHDALSDPGSP